MSYALGHDDTDATAPSHRSRRLPRVPRRQRLQLDGERGGILRCARCVRVGWRQLHRHGRRLRVVGARARRRRVRVDHRPVDGVAGAAEPHHRRDQGGPAERPRGAGTNDNPARGRGVAPAARRRSYRSLLRPQGRPQDAPRGDLARLRRAGPRRQGALRGRLQLHGAAAGRGARDLLPGRPGSLRRAAAALQPRAPGRVRRRARGLVRAGVGGLRAVFFAGEGVSLGQVPARRRGGKCQGRLGSCLSRRAGRALASRPGRDRSGPPHDRRGGVAGVATGATDSRRADRQRTNGGPGA